MLKVDELVLYKGKCTKYFSTTRMDNLRLRIQDSLIESWSVKSRSKGN